MTSDLRAPGDTVVLTLAILTREPYERRYFHDGTTSFSQATQITVGEHSGRFVYLSFPTPHPVAEAQRSLRVEVRRSTLERFLADGSYPRPRSEHLEFEAFRVVAIDGARYQEPQSNPADKMDSSVEYWHRRAQEENLERQRERENSR